MIQNKPTFFKNLDGLRAVAALTVILAHLCYYFEAPHTPFYDFFRKFLSAYGRGGNFGVNFFFIISGFLITYLMFIEQSKNGKLNVIYFYVRRIFRIWPLYFATLIIGFLIYPFIVYLFTGHKIVETANWLLYVLFAANYDLIYNGHSSTGILNIQWSVAIEEQFYLLWPIVFVLFNRTKMFLFLLFGCIVFSEYFYSINGFDSPDWEYHFGSCLRYLSFGGLLAYLCYHKTETVYFYLNKINRPLMFVIYLVCAMLMLFKSKFTGSHFAYYIYDVILMLFLGFIIVEQNFSMNSFYKIGSFRLLNWLGKISYGLYLTHTIAIVIVLAVFSKDPDFVVWKVLSTIAITILISHFSYYYFEKYFLSLKGKFSK